MKTMLYSFFVVLSFVLAYGGVYFLGAKEERKEVAQLIPITFVSAVFSAILYTFVVSTAQGNTAFGLSSLGGAIGYVCGLFVYNKVRPIVSFKTILTRFIRALPLIYGISKVGCYFRGCCGNPDLSFSLQLVEGLSFVVLFLVGLACSPNILIILCCVLKFCLEFFRNSDGCVLTANQITCIVILTVSIAIIIFSKCVNPSLCRKNLN